KDGTAPGVSVGFCDAAGTRILSRAYLTAYQSIQFSSSGGVEKAILGCIVIHQGPAMPSDSLIINRIGPGSSSVAGWTRIGAGRRKCRLYHSPLSGRFAAALVSPFAALRYSKSSGSLSSRS